MWPENGRVGVGCEVTVSKWGLSGLIFGANYPLQVFKKNLF